jgi:fatty-acyl-CoA synthase
MAMMDVPLNSWLMLDNVERNAGDTEVVSQVAPGVLHRYTYADFIRRSQQLMHALDRLGLDEGARVATLAWNTYRHLESYFAIPCSGRVLHTLNLRLSPEDLSYIIGHADDRVIIVDADQLPLLEKIGDGLAGVTHIVVMADEAPQDEIAGKPLLAYEELISVESGPYPRKNIDEQAPLGICYTSGTTGRPKGAVYTHRSSYLHAITATSKAGVGIGPMDCVLPIVPMFHANCWGFPHAAVMVGAKQVFAGAHMDPAAVVKLLHDEAVTITAGVPTIWMMCADEFAKQGRPPELQYMICGGSQPPRAMMERYERDFGVPIVQAWGMTETSPLASIAWPKYNARSLELDGLMDRVRTRAGLQVPGVSVSLRDAAQQEVPWDGESMGDLYIRGPFIVDSYLHGDGAEQFTDDGWFKTGDVAIGYPDGYFVIADRTKDLIKSGGEWISSVDMEGAIMAMPGVAEAAVIAIPDEKWDERPLACLVLEDGARASLEQIHAHLSDRGWAKWQLPDRLEVIEAIPKTGVGKFDKKVLRARFE